MATKIDKKAEKMKGKTEEIRRTFNLPDTESVIQDYSCVHHIKGKMYITQNYALFVPSLGSTTVQIPFRRFENMKKDSFGFTIETDSSESHSFSMFVGKKDEAYNLVYYLWKHPPSYVELDQEETYIDPTAVDDDAQGFNGVGNPFAASNRNPEDIEREWGSMSQQVKVDTDTSKRAVRKVLEARDMGTSALAELTIQAEQIDRIEREVDKIHANLDKGDRLLRGMESVGGAMKNALTKEKGREGIAFEDRTLEIKKEYPPVDFEILQKLPNDHLEPAILRFVEDKLLCIDPETKSPYKNSIWPFDKVDSVVVRARHQHLDIRFTESKWPRFRLCTSFTQGVVNELALRYKGELRVIFEPGTRQFSYGKPMYSNINASQPRTGFFRKPGEKQRSALTKTVFKDAPDEVRRQIDQQEEDLDEISSVLTDINAIASVMGEELDRQTEQLGRVTGSVDHANERMKKTNRRVDNLL